jgi:hypothetical protein
MTNKVVLSFLCAILLSSFGIFSAKVFAQAQQIPAEVFGALPEYEGRTKTLCLLAFDF